MQHVQVKISPGCTVALKMGDYDLQLGLILYILVDFHIHCTYKYNKDVCLTRVRGAAGSSLTGVTVLCPLARHNEAKLGLMCLAQGHNAMMPMRLEPAALGLESSILPLSHCAPYTVEVSKVFRQNNTILKKNTT